jgi:hypothetical protein
MTHRRALVKVSTKAKQPVNPRALLQKSVSMVVCSEKNASNVRVSHLSQPYWEEGSSGLSGNGPDASDGNVKVS